MRAPASSAHVVIVGGGATGLSTAFWLRREGVAVTVIEKGIVGWEASGRNGGGATHAYSPLFREEQRLWPMMDDLLGYPTEYQPGRVRIALNPAQLGFLRDAVDLAARQGFVAEELDRQAMRDLVPWVPDDVAGGMSTATAARPIRNAPCKPTPGPCRTSAAPSCSTPWSPGSTARAAG